MGIKSRRNSGKLMTANVNAYSYMYPMSQVNVSHVTYLYADWRSKLELLLTGLVTSLVDGNSDRKWQETNGYKVITITLCLN